MTLKTLPLGVIGLALAAAGAVAYRDRKSVV